MFSVVEMLTCPSCSCAIFTGTFRSLSSRHQSRGPSSAQRWRLIRRSLSGPLGFVRCSTRAVTGVAGLRGRDRESVDHRLHTIVLSSDFQRASTARLGGDRPSQGDHAVLDVDVDVAAAQQILVNHLRVDLQDQPPVLHRAMAPCFRRALFDEQSAGHGSTARAAVVVVVTRKKCYPVPACASWCPASHR